MIYFISIILVIIVLIIIGLLLRKRVYDTVDRQEAWKLNIMNRNMAAELSRMKDLNLSGETKDKFERWRHRWDEIVTEELAEVEELLFDAEDAADRYRFPTARKIVHRIENILMSIEKDLDDILEQLYELLDTEEKSREEMEQLEPMIKELRRNLLTNQYQYDRASIRFELELNKFDESVNKYDELVENGDYLEAKGIVDDVKSRLTDFQNELEEFPALYKQCKHELPLKLDDVYRGIQEMKLDGYYIEHLGFEKEIKDYQGRLLDCVQELEKTGSDKVKKIIPEIETRIQEMYHLLEKEAIARNYLETKVPSYKQALTDFRERFSKTQAEVDDLKHAYQFTDEDMENYLALEKMMTQLESQLEEFTIKNENSKQAHSKLRYELEAGFEQLEKIEKEHEVFLELIQNLRKDEIEAKEILAQMREQIYDTHRKLKRSNIPGVPDFIWDTIANATKKNERVITALEKQPLDILEVQENLSEAKAAVDQAVSETNKMLEQAYLTERVIQYANRYRSSFPALAKKLSESERLFRSYEYELALEKAAKAVEEVEPGALERIEKFQEDIVI